MQRGRRQQITCTKNERYKTRKIWKYRISFFLFSFVLIFIIIIYTYIYI